MRTLEFQILRFTEKLHPAKETNENGRELTTLCTTHSLTPVNTWKAKAIDRTEWNGFTHVGPKNSTSRIDYFLVSADCLEDCSDVFAQFGDAEVLQPGINFINRTCFDHIPLTMTIFCSLRIANNEHPRTKWHYPKLRNAIDDQKTRQDFVDEDHQEHARWGGSDTT